MTDRETPKEADTIERLHEIWARTLRENGGREFVGNAPTAETLVMNGSIPVRVDQAAYGTTYVCSVYTTMIDYAIAELDIVSNISAMKKRAFRLLAFFLSTLFRGARIDEVVSVNNFLLSTNFYPSYHRGIATKIIEELVGKYPKHAIMFRSLTERCNGDLIQELQQAGCFLIPSRQVFIIDPKKVDLCRLRNVRKDRNLLRTTQYKIVEHHELHDADFARIVKLYDLLYLDKYPQYNPAFTEDFIRFVHQHELMRFVGLRNKEGDLDGIKGYYRRGNNMTSSILGYDTTLPKATGLYRMLSALSILYAEKHGLLFNMSSGVGPFKLARGAVKEIEYSAVYTKHLNLSLKKATWVLLRGLLNSIVLPMMKKHDF